MGKVLAFRNVSWLAFIALIIGSCGDKEKEMVKAEKLPNIVYVLADDLGIGDIHSFNAEGKINTPNIDRLAQEGMTFTDAHTSSAVCSPTRYGILTGRYNWRSPLKSGVLTGVSKALIPSSRTTVASLLKKANYTTAFVGKWHLGWDWALIQGDSVGGSGWNPTDYVNLDFAKPITNGPNDLGFDYSYGFSGSLDMAPYVYVENGLPTMVPDSVTGSTDKYGWWREGPTASDFVHEQVTPHLFGKAMEYIKEKSQDNAPFFLYLALPSPHTPILPTPDWQGKSDLNPYGDFVMEIDGYMGQLQKTLAETGIEDNTIVIFTSDNGSSPQADYKVLGEKGHNPSSIYRGHKADIFEGGHREPFIVRWPGKIKPGTTSDKTICTTDLMATCADIINIQLADNEGEDSYSMLPLFLDPNSADYQRETTVHHSINGSFALRKGRWKMIFCPGSGGWSDPKPDSKEVVGLPEYQLYDLSKDPSEENNLYVDNPDIEEEMKNMMVSLIHNGRSTPGKIQKNDPPLGDKEWEQVAIFSKKAME